MERQRLYHRGARARAYGDLMSTTGLCTAVLAASLVTLGTAGPALAQTRVWTSATTDYNTAANWTAADVPDSAGETASFAGAGTGTVVVSAPVTLDAWTISGGTIYAISGAAVTLNGTGITNSATIAQSIANNIGGTGGITLSANNTFTVSGANTYTGTVLVQNGSLFLAGTNTGVTSATVTGGSLVLINGAGNSLSANAAITVTAGNLAVQNNETVGSIGGAGGTVSIANATILTTGSLGSTTYDGIVQGNGALTKVGTGATFVLTGANTYVGTTTVSEGILNIRNATALGSTAGGTIVTSGATLQLEGTIAVGAEALSLAGLGVGGNGALQGVSGNNSFAGAITLSGGTTRIQNDTAATTLTLTGGITGAGQTLNVGGAGNTLIGTVGITTGAGGLVKDGAGTLTLSGTGAYTGTTTVNAGTLAIDTFGALWTTGDMVINGGTLNFDNAIVNAESLSGAVGVLSLSAINGAAELTFGRDNTNTTFSGNVTGTALTGLVKEGTGTTTLSGTVTTAGAITVLGGTLELSGNNTIAGITVDGTGRLRLLSNGAAGGAAGQITTTGSVISYANGVNSATPIAIDSSTTQFEVLGADIAQQSGITSEIAGPRPLEKIGTGTLILSGTNAYTGATTITAGTLALSGGSAILDANTVNIGLNGTLAILTSETVGVINNTGTVTMQDGTPGQVLTTATYAAASTLNVDVNLGPGGGTADRLVVTGAGAASGSTTVNFANTGAGVILHPDILVVDTNGGAATFVAGAGLPAVGLVQYSLVQSGQDWVLRASTGAAGAVIGNIAVVQGTLGAIVNRPSSPFVSSLAAQVDPNYCGPGIWTREVGGGVKASSTTSQANQPNAVSSVSLGYVGAQFGADIACFKLGDAGIDVAVGAIAGYNQGSGSQPVPNGGTTNSSFSQGYGGAYATFAMGQLSADIQARVDATRFAFTNPNIQLNNTTLDTVRTTLSGSASYAIPLMEDMAVVPTAGFSASRTTSGVLTFTTGQTLTPNVSLSLVGFIGGTIAKTIVQADNISAIQPFLTATFYKDVAANPTGVFFDPASGVSQNLTSTHLGAFSEISLGTNYFRLFEPGAAGPKQLNATVRVDARFSDILMGAGLTAQLRSQF